MCIPKTKETMKCTNSKPVRKIQLGSIQEGTLQMLMLPKPYLPQSLHPIWKIYNEDWTNSNKLCDGIGLV